MPAPLAYVLFGLAALAIVLAEGMILRSTARALRPLGVRAAALEWVYAIVPALALAAALVLTWRAIPPRDTEPDVAASHTARHR